MKTFNFTEQEISLLSTALQSVYEQHMEVIKTNRPTLGTEVVKQITDKAYEYVNLRKKIDK